MQPTRTEAIKRFLMAKTHQDLADRYNYEMEVQVSVGQDGGEKIEGTYQGRNWQGFQGPEGQIWKSFRIPYKANTEPEYEDVAMSYDLEAHALGIGMTGWNWVKRQSEWWAYDFDAIKGHADSHSKKLTNEELAEIQEQVQSIPWVSVRRSTSGKGLHFYVYSEGFSTSNHNEHMAVGRAILSYMSAIVGYDFQSKVDANSGNFWVWHRKMAGTNGLELLKEGEVFSNSQIPANWKDYINVVSGKQKRNIPQFVDPKSIDVFEQVSGQSLRVTFDEEHKALIEYLRTNNCMWWYDSEHHMLVTHTIHLKEAHESLGLRGIFETVATGSQRGSDINCFMYPLRGGAWVVRRYTREVNENNIWEKDQSGYTKCYFNRKTDLKIAARICGGVNLISGNFVFQNGEDVERALKMIGSDLEIPSYVKLGRPFEVKQKENLIEISVTADRKIDTTDKLPGWIFRTGKWRKVIQVTNVTIETVNYDDKIRHLVEISNEDAGWCLKSDGVWRLEPYKHVNVMLKSDGFSSKEVEMVMGSAISRPWTIANLPFQPEYPGDRTWNKGAAKLRIFPADEMNPNGCPNWMKILSHLGKGLNDDIKTNEWCQENGITSGADYLKIWIASMIQKPLEPLPYLFFCSPEENTGKSTFHEALRLIIENGIVFADNALTNSNGFNGELANAVLCIVEETSLQSNKQAHARIRSWVTSRQLPIHAKRETPYSIPNSSHWIQFSNDPKACPIFQGDTRITMLMIDPFEVDEIIPWRVFEDRLRKEAPYFLAELLALEIPESEDRLNLPVITTREKIAIQVMNETPLESFLNEQTHFVPGKMIKVSELWDKFYEWLSPNERDNWSKISMGKQMPTKYPKGRRDDANWAFGNISFEPRKPDEHPLPLLIIRDGKLSSIGAKVK